MSGCTCHLAPCSQMTKMRGHFLPFLPLLLILALGQALSQRCYPKEVALLPALQFPWQRTVSHQPLKPVVGESGEGRGEGRRGTEKAGQHLLGENSWWIYKELVCLVSYQVLHCSIFRNFEMREASSVVSTSALQGWLYKYPPSRPHLLPLIPRQTLLWAAGEAHWLGAWAVLDPGRDKSGGGCPPPATPPKASTWCCKFTAAPGAGRQTESMVTVTELGQEGREEGEAWAPPLPWRPSEAPCRPLGPLGVQPLLSWQTHKEANPQ